MYFYLAPSYIIIQKYLPILNADFTIQIPPKHDINFLNYYRQFIKINIVVSMYISTQQKSLLDRKK